MRRIQLLLVCLLLISGSMTAQEKGPKRKHVSYEQMTALMTKELQLDAKQQKKVAKLNKKYKTLIEGEERKTPERQRPDMGDMPQGGPDGGFGGGGDFGGGGFGGGMPGEMPCGRGGMGRPMGGGMPGGQAAEKSYDYDKKQQIYDKAIKKILSESQMQGYEKIKPQFASQRRVKEFLLGGQQELTH
ncbi:hypothetical protein [uncultured Prevotella sp.]|uniref:hypothetical protein n=1 Tax=uncultured Prevotella sp. TaxID=159272 RepID=UPI002586655D|nr:hypothetical protein [uncultured Prevotella sp.]